MKYLRASLLALALMSPVAAQAAVPLPQNQHVIQSLTAARVADQIRKACPSISARMIHAFFKAQQLYDYALNQGYSRSEINAFLKDKQEKARIKALATAYIKDHKASETDPASLCALGNREIAQKTITGDLLSRN